MPEDSSADMFKYHHTSMICPRLQYQRNWIMTGTDVRDNRIIAFFKGVRYQLHYHQTGPHFNTWSNKIHQLKKVQTGGRRRWGTGDSRQTRKYQLTKQHNCIEINRIRHFNMYKEPSRNQIEGSKSRGEKRCRNRCKRKDESSDVKTDSRWLIASSAVFISAAAWLSRKRQAGRLMSDRSPNREFV